MRTKLGRRCLNSEKTAKSVFFPEGRSSGLLWWHVGALLTVTPTYLLTYLLSHSRGAFTLFLRGQLAWPLPSTRLQLSLCLESATYEAPWRLSSHGSGSWTSGWLVLVMQGWPPIRPPGAHRRAMPRAQRSLQNRSQSRIKEERDRVDGRLAGVGSGEGRWGADRLGATALWVSRCGVSGARAARYGFAH